MGSAKSAAGERDAALSSLGRLLEPVVELLLRLGVTAAEAESVMRDTFVREANRAVTDETGRSQASLIALRCGLYRGEIRKRLARLADSDAEPLPGATASHRLDRLLRGWHSDPEFTTSEGMPREIPLMGKKSFEALSQRYAANLYPSIILRELERVGAVVRVAGGRVRVLQGEFRAAEVSGDRLEEMGTHGSDLLHALISDAHEHDSGRLVMVAEGIEIDPRYLPLLRKTLISRSKAFMKLLDEQLNDELRRVPAGGARVAVMLVGTHGFAQAPAVPANGATNVKGPGRRRRAAEKRRARSQDR
jgi:hypothetical protein